MAPRIEPPRRAKLERGPFVSATLFAEEAVAGRAAERAATWLSLASRWNVRRNCSGLAFSESLGCLTATKGKFIYPKGKSPQGEMFYILLIRPLAATSLFLFFDMYISHRSPRDRADERFLTTGQPAVKMEI